MTTATNSHVMWPTEGYTDSGEGGLEVFLLVRKPAHDDFRQCYTHSTKLNASGVNIFGRTEAVVGRNNRDATDIQNFESLEAAREAGYSFSTRYFPEEEILFPNLWKEESSWRRESAELYACVTLAQTDKSLHSKDQGYFHATFDDLTPSAKELYHTLQTLYGVSDEYMHLLTVLDT